MSDQETLMNPAPVLPDGMGRLIVQPPGLVAFTYAVPLEQPVNLGPLQCIVGGNIEFIVPSSQVTEHHPFISIFGNEEARILNHPENPRMTTALRDVYGYSMLGTFVITSADSMGNTIALDDSEALAVQRNLTGMVNIRWTDFPAELIGYISALHHG